MAKRKTSMSKTADIGKVFATGSFHVLWGLVVSTVISLVATIFRCSASRLGPVGFIRDSLGCPYAYWDFQEMGSELRHCTLLGKVPKRS